MCEIIGFRPSVAEKALRKRNAKLARVYYQATRKPLPVRAVRANVRALRTNMR